MRVAPVVWHRLLGHYLGGARDFVAKKAKKRHFKSNMEWLVKQLERLLFQMWALQSQGELLTYTKAGEYHP